jgi:hypothetical protein
MKHCETFKNHKNTFGFIKNHWKSLEIIKYVSTPCNVIQTHIGIERALGSLGLGEPGPQQLEHKQNIWVVAWFFGLARESQPKKQSNKPNPSLTNHRLLRES